MIRFDCHAHVYEKVNAISGARYIPEHPAPLSTWRKHLQTHGLEGGVIVQVSFLGTDNAELCAALAQLDRRRYAGIAVVPTSVSEAEIDRLYSAGVRGFRWNLVRGAALPDLQNAEVREFLSRVQQRAMHLEVHLESLRLATFIGPLLDTGMTVVVDHLGLPSEPDPAHDPWINAIRQRGDLSQLYVKFSAPYRTSFDTRKHAMVLQELLAPDHAIWGSDWPHTQYEGVTSYAEVAAWRLKSGLIFHAKAVESLYGLESPDG